MVAVAEGHLCRSEQGGRELWSGKEVEIVGCSTAAASGGVLPYVVGNPVVMEIRR